MIISSEKNSNSALALARLYMGRIGEEKIGGSPVGHIKDARLNLNYDLAEKLGIKIPNDLEGDN